MPVPAALLLAPANPAARDLLRGIEAGGSQAQVAVAAYDQARNDCADAASEAYGVRL